jgi:penicillin-binding protein 1A
VSAHEVDPKKSATAKKRATTDRAWAFKTFFIAAVSGSVLLLLVAGVFWWYFSRDLPKIITAADYRPPIVSKILGSGGDPNALMGEFFRNERRYVIPYEKIPEKVVQAFISAEDDQFFTHGGFNVMSMVRASLANARAGHVVQGASTISQQVTKSLLLSSEKSFGRKIRELILASRLEHNLTKQQILYLYLNQIYLGHGAWGVQAAAQTYFRKDVSELSLAECAILAGMPQAPGKYSPLQNPKKAKERQLYVLRRMAENKYITQAQMSDAAAAPLRIFHDENINLKYGAYLVEYVRQYLMQKYGEKAVYEGGLTAEVPATRELSLTAHKSLQDGLRAVDKRNGFRGPIQHLSSDAEMEKFLRELRLEMVDRKLHFQVLQPDGTLDAFEGLRQQHLTDEQLLESGEMYKAVVTSFDDKKKVAFLMVGAVRVELPVEKMKWAHLEGSHAEVTLPSKILKRGDVVWVRPETSSTGSEPVVALEQEPQLQGALFSIEAETGKVLAMEGGYDYEENEFNRATQAHRQPGSSFKPIIYSAALEKGYTPSSILIDSPVVYEDADTGKWKPNNFEEKFYGDTTFRQALVKSRNVPTIKIVQSIQVPYVIDYAHRLGMTTQFPNDLSISLGSGTTSLEELTRVYALFPRLGRKVDPIFVTKVTDRDGRVLEENQPKPLAPPHIAQFAPGAAPSPEPSLNPSATGQLQGPLHVIIPPYPPQDDPDQVLDPRVAFVMTSLMKEVVNYGTGHDAKSLGRAAAGKTGTTSDYLDAWFMGFTPNVVTGVWVGNDSQKSIGSNETGARAALPVWLSFMKEAIKGYPEVEFKVPTGVVFATIDPVSGKLAPSNSSSAVQEAYIEGTQPTAEAEGSTKVTPQTRSDFFKEDTE